LGIEVDPINTVQFSNHTGYPTWKGEVLDGEKLSLIFQGLVDNDLHGYSYLLTGYMSSPSALRNILKIREKLLEKNPKLLFVCDPVMGDQGKLYVPKELVNIYKDEVIPKADFLFPNQTECEFLTDMRITSDADALQAIDKLHQVGPKVVIITSFEFGDRSFVSLLGSIRNDDGKTSRRFKMQVPRFDRSFTGTGDLFAALLLAWYSIDGDVVRACEKAVNSLQAVLSKTVKAASGELLLIQSKHEIETPPNIYRAQLFTEPPQ